MLTAQDYKEAYEQANEQANEQEYDMTNSINDYSNLEQHLLNDFQRDLSLSTSPYADMAKQLGVSEEEVLLSINSLQDRGVISRVGPVFRPNRIGVSTLAAMAVPAENLECVARIVSEEHLDIVLYEIEQHTEYPLMSLPMLEDYFIDLGFQLKQANKS